MFKPFWQVRICVFGKKKVENPPGQFRVLKKSQKKISQINFFIILGSKVKDLIYGLMVIYLLLLMRTLFKVILLIKSSETGNEPWEI